MMMLNNNIIMIMIIPKLKNEWTNEWIKNSRPRCEKLEVIVRRNKTKTNSYEKIFVKI